MPSDPEPVTSLRALLAARFPTLVRKPGLPVATGVKAIDEALGGGLPAGRLTELVSAAASSGGQLVLARLLITTRAARQRVALVDSADRFAPEAVPADALRHLVWARTKKLDEAMAAADILVRDGNYSALVLDVRGIAERALRRQPATGWYRLQRAAENHPAAVLVQTPFPLVPAVPWRLILRTPLGLAARRRPQETLAAQLVIETVRGQATATHELSA